MSTPVKLLPRTGAGYRWLPYRFDRLGDSTVFVSNAVGEFLILEPGEFDQLAVRNVTDERLLRRLAASHLVQFDGDNTALDLLAMKTRTKLRRLSRLTGLHLFVVTLRCEHTCSYCQVSRQTTDQTSFDMSVEDAMRALDVVFSSPNPAIKIEFQGGEPLLNFGLVTTIVEEAEARGERLGKEVAFVIATNLALLSDEIIAYCREHSIYLSTSLDGPRELHNRSRHRPGDDSFQRAVEGIERVHSELGVGWVSALMTTTDASLGRAKDIVDTYAELGLGDVFLRPLSPYGFARRSSVHLRYDTSRWLRFYEEGLRHIVELNRGGTPMVEDLAAVYLKKMLTNDDPGYVDLQSPSGIGIGALVYNYDGDIYAADEGRMLAEMGDFTFRLGSVRSDSFEDLMLSDALLDPLEESFAGSAPMCSDCSFEPYCGADPVLHHATFGDFLGRKAESSFCQRTMGIVPLLAQMMRADPFVRSLFMSWASR